jgi:hypothetical protein
LLTLTTVHLSLNADANQADCAGDCSAAEAPVDVEKEEKQEQQQEEPQEEKQQPCGPDCRHWRYGGPGNSSFSSSSDNLAGIGQRMEIIFPGDITVRRFLGSGG